MTEQNYEDDNGVTLGQIFKVMFYNKIRLLIVGVSILVILLLYLNLGYNKSKKQYSASFSYNDINITNGHYSDGSLFDINDLVDYVDDVKKTNSKYDSINTNIKKLGINIDKELVSQKITNAAGNEETQITTVYSIVVNASCFSNYNQAKEFLSDLISYPITRSNEMISSINFDDNLLLFDSSKVYENQINYLTLQEKYILEGYDDLIEAYGDMIIGDKKLSSRVKDIELYFDDNKLSVLTNEMELNGYVKDLATYKNSLETEKAALELELETNLQKINDLNTAIKTLIGYSTSSTLQTLDLTAYNNSINQLTQRNVDIQYEINVIDRYLNSSGTYTSEKQNDFESRLLAFRTKLSEFTKTYKDCYLEAVSNYKISYSDANMVVASGGFSMTTSIVISVLVGLVVACIVNLCVDHKMLSKDYTKEEKQVDKLETK